ncbi:PRC-barrel domain-containing protein [Fundidesulfovibrio putealis]|uniref:PRC-barrel domain-containing protein n=1 Tax=Fundidesulfovibrio putealis TaxID=270496 RepID=UPI0004286334|nr:PRC-barrel domain-containing protein [Fundidesulfovibrio putealis]
MKFYCKSVVAAMILSLSLAAGAALAQTTPVVGTIGITPDEIKVLAKGWSIKKDILSKDVFNEASEKVGVIEDIIVTPDKALSYSIVSTGGFLGMAKHDVVIPVNQFKIQNKRIVLPGATKEAVKAMPEFKYAE